jgi:hypothetical protein
MTYEMIIQFISEFTGEHVNDIRMIYPDELVKVYNHIQTIYSDIHLGTPPKVINLGGNEFELINPSKVGIGWHIDFANIDIEKDPVKAACLFYYPKGVKYGVTDENKNLLHPIRSRYNLVEREMDLQTFMSASAFFLRKIKKSMMLSMESQKATNRIVKVLERLSGRTSSTSSQKSTTEGIGTP